MYCTASFALVSDRAKLKRIGGFLMMGLLNPSRVSDYFHLSNQLATGIWYLVTSTYQIIVNCRKHILNNEKSFNRPITFVL